MLLHKTKSFYNIGLSYKLLGLRIVDLTFKFFLKCKFYDLQTWTHTQTCRFFSELGLVLRLMHQELRLIEIFFAELRLVLGLVS